MSSSTSSQKGKPKSPLAKLGSPLAKLGGLFKTKQTPAPKPAPAKQPATKSQQPAATEEPEAAPPPPPSPAAAAAPEPAPAAPQREEKYREEKARRKQRDKSPRLAAPASLAAPEDEPAALSEMLGSWCGADGGSGDSDERSVKEVAEVTSMAKVGELWRGGGKMVEPETLTKFESAIGGDEDGKPAMLCVGMGVRQRFFVKFYAVALYADLKQLAAKFDTPPESTQAIVDQLILTGVSKRFDIVMVRALSGKKFQQGIFDAIEPRLSELLDKKKEVKKLITQLQTCLPSNDLGPGDRICIVLRGDGAVEIWHAGGKGRIRSEDDALSAAFADLFLGDECIVPDFRKAVMTGARAALAYEQAKEGF